MFEGGSMGAGGGGARIENGEAMVDAWGGSGGGAAAMGGAAVLVGAMGAMGVFMASGWLKGLTWGWCDQGVRSGWTISRGWDMGVGELGGD